MDRYLSRRHNSLAMRQTTYTLKATQIKPLFLVGIVCFCIIICFYKSASMAMNDEEMATLLSHTHDSVIKDSKNRTYVNLIIFLQAGIGLAFITVPFVITVYRNRAVLHRINRRVQWFKDRKDAAVMGREGEADRSEDHFSRQLLLTHPNLTPHDLKLCSLLRQNLSSKEIAEELNITPGSVNTARYRLRKKVDLPKDVDLIIYLNQIA